jgi:glycosyltransferase involved in cell wall biosynthesis
MKVAIGVHGRFHAFELATALHEQGDCDVEVATTYPRWAARRFLPPDLAVRSASWLEFRRRLHQRLRLGPAPDSEICKAFGRFVARALPADADVFVGWSSASLEPITAAKARGVLTVLERGSTHILHQQDVLERIHGEQGRRFSGIPGEIVERELAEYEAADIIAVPTPYAAETFQNRGLESDRIFVNPYGVDSAEFACGDRPVRRLPTILFVGTVGLRKGVPDLLAAFARLGGIARLRIVGPVDPGYAPALPEGATLVGALDRAGVIGELHAADVFCLPSQEEGLALSLLQAMAAGLPVVATPESGASAVVANDIEGLIVPAGDVDSLAAALTRLSMDPDRRHRQGASAFRKASELTWDAYGKRALAGYKAAIGKASPTSPAALGQSDHGIPAPKKSELQDSLRRR